MTSICNNVSANIKEYEGIVAIVNGDIITSLDLEERVNLVIFSMGGSIDEKTKEKLRLEVLKEMINGYIKKQHINKFAPKGGWVAKIDVENAFKDIAKRNGMTEEQFRNLLKSKYINPEILLNQILNNFEWIEYVKAKFGNKINISSYELKRIATEVKEKLEKESFYVYRMFFPFTDSRDEKNVVVLVNNLYQILLKGADFANVARQFSKSPDAKNGGELGWVFEGQLPSQEIVALKEMKVGTYKIIRNNKGYVILYLKEKKGEGLKNYTNISFIQVIVPFGDQKPSKEQVSATVNYINEMKKNSKNYSDFINQAKNDEFIHISNITTGVLEAMQPKFRNAIEKTGVGKMSETIVFDEGIIVICLLDKKSSTIKAPTQNEIRIQKIDDRLNAAARNELNFLKRKSHITLNSKYSSELKAN